MARVCLGIFAGVLVGGGVGARGCRGDGIGSRGLGDDAVALG